MPSRADLVPRCFTISEVPNTFDRDAVMSLVMKERSSATVTKLETVLGGESDERLSRWIVCLKSAKDAQYFHSNTQHGENKSPDDEWCTVQYLQTSESEIPPSWLDMHDDDDDDAGDADADEDDLNDEDDDLLSDEDQCPVSPTNSDKQARQAGHATINSSFDQARTFAAAQIGPQPGVVQPSFPQGLPGPTPVGQEKTGMPLFMPMPQPMLPPYMIPGLGLPGFQQPYFPPSMPPPPGVYQPNMAQGNMTPRLLLPWQHETYGQSQRQQIPMIYNDKEKRWVQIPQQMIPQQMKPQQMAQGGPNVPFPVVGRTVTTQSQSPGVSISPRYQGGGSPIINNGKERVPGNSPINANRTNVKEPKPGQPHEIRELIAYMEKLQQKVNRDNQAKDTDEGEKAEDEQPTSILVSGIPPTKIDEDYLTMFFENTKRFGGGPVTSIEINEEEGLAIVKFNDPEAVQTVLMKQSSEPILLSNTEIRVKVYVPEKAVDGADGKPEGNQRPRDLSRREMEGSYFDFYCYPCHEDERRFEEAVGYCKDCRDYLCDECCSSHHRAKPSRKHVVLDSTHMPIDLLSFARTERSTYTCNKHPNKAIEYFCHIHDILACSSCAFADHRSCDKVDPIADVDIHGTNRSLSETQMQLQALARHASQTLQISQDSICLSNKCTNDAIQSVKTYIHGTISTLEKLEKELEAEATEVDRQNEKRIKAASSESDSVLAAIQGTLQSLSTLEKNKQYCNLFAALKHLQKILPTLKTGLERIRRDCMVEQIKFKPILQLQDMLSHKEGIGNIITPQAHTGE